MALNYVNLILDGFDGGGTQLTRGTATFTPSVLLTDPTDQEWIPLAPVSVTFREGLAAPQVSLLATDNANVLPAGWGWKVSFLNVPGTPAPFDFFLPFSGGATQRLSAIQPVQSVTTMQAYLPVPNGTPAAGNVPIATGNGEQSAWGSPGAASLPLTTLGDILYENANPAPARLPGNATATKKFLTQTGTGTVSAAPAWGTIATGDLPAGVGTVTSVSVTTANGFAGTVATATTTPAITVSTTVTGLLKGNGTAVSAAVAGTDYLAPNGNGSALTGLTESQISGLTADLAAKLPIAGGTMTGWLAPAAVSLTFGTTISVNAALGNAFNLTLTASTGTIANPTNPVDGQVIRFRISQDATGSRTVAWGTAYDFGTAGAPTLTTTASKVDIIGFEYVSSISKWCYVGSGLGF